MGPRASFERWHAVSEENRRAGDWLHRDQRKRAKTEQERELSAGPKWYDQTFWIVVFLVVFWPVGIVLAWRSRWPLAGKLVATLFVVACVYLSLSMQAYVRGLG